MVFAKFIWKVSGRCLEGVWNVYGRCLEGVWNVYGRCLEGVWIMSKLFGPNYGFCQI